MVLILEINIINIYHYYYYNNGSSDSQEVPVSMENVHPEKTEDQYVTSPSG